MSDENTTDNVHVTDEPTVLSTDNVHVTDEPLTVKAAADSGTVTTDNVHVTDEEA
ncbi:MULTISPECIES: hypothetical protein [unclassified Streptomyces]|uniref:hypothetical protein n=1 Tax=unclassified Streptomyces TaxID=2593676 RepID=UPI00190C2781|nr:MULTISPECIES: hypothetical protein [unclassified Streptomyces]MBK3567959.1 hypothetical protein [Streptomyces sp. MBT62]MBK6016913.1 hypothetical protein [Streptomyces sp. MBT53]